MGMKFRKVYLKLQICSLVLSYYKKYPKIYNFNISAVCKLSTHLNQVYCKLIKSIKNML